MRNSESIKEIAPAFLLAQTDMDAATKDATNPHFGSKYADFASVVGVVKPLLNKNDISFLQPVRLTDAGVEIETILMHKSGEFFSEVLSIPLVRRDAQGVGSAISYGKRYALQSICGVPSEDDDGNIASEKPQQRPAAKAPEKRQEVKPDTDITFKHKVSEALAAQGIELAHQKIAVDVIKSIINKDDLLTIAAADRGRFIKAIADGKYTDAMKKEIDRVLPATEGPANPQPFAAAVYAAFKARGAETMEHQREAARNAAKSMKCNDIRVIPEGEARDKFLADIAEGSFDKFIKTEKAVA